MAKILIFEDDQSLALYWQQLLEQASHEVRCCDSVEQAMEIVALMQPDLIVADMLIKQEGKFVSEGGLSLVSKLRLREQFVGCILGVSGFRRGPYAQNTALDAARNMGIDMALYKPITAEQLLDAVAQLLDSCRIPGKTLS
jgi:CheY-like chemotaxis protein